MLFWLFVHPAAWRNHVGSIDPELRPTFSLMELSGRQWRNRSLRRFLLQAYLGWLPFMALAVALALRAAGIHPDYITFGVTYAVVFGLMISLAVGAAVSVAGGVAGGLLLGLSGGILGGFLASYTHGIPAMIGGPFGLTGGDVPVSFLGMSLGLLIPAVSLGAAYGAAGSVALGLAGYRRGGSSPGQVGGVLAGALVGGAIYGIANTIPFVAIEKLTGYGTAVIFSGVVFGITSSLTVGWHTGKWRASLLYGGLFCLAIILSGMFATRQIVRELAFHLSCGLADCRGYAQFYYAGIPVIFVTVIVSSSAPFALAYILGERAAGSRSGAVAGMLGAAGAVVALLTTFDPSSPFCRYPATCLSPTFLTIFLNVFILTFGSALIVLTAAWWRPLLFYPAAILWNFALFRLDVQQRPNRRQGSRLRRHTAFWDEHQRLHLPGLDEYLIWVAEHYPDEARPAMDYLATGRQRRAVQAATIELEARRLERYTHNVNAIASAHRQLAAGELSGPASALLRSFSRLSQDVEAALNQATAYHRRLALRGVEDRLDNLLRELTRSSEPYAARFYPIAAGWRQAVGNYRHKLAETAELHQEIDNPYIFGVPLTEEQEIFVGRTDISSRIEQLLLDPRRPPLLLYGQRRMGKTSLLRNLGRLLPSTIVPLFVDGEGAAGASSYADFLYHVGWQMAQSAEAQRGLLLPPLSRERIEANPFTAFVEWLHGVEQALDRPAQQMALLMLDEFEAVDSVLDRGRFDAGDVMRTLRHLIQHLPHFKVLLAGSHTLGEFQRWASYLINVQVVKVGYLDAAEAIQLIEQPVQGFPLRYEAEACRRVLALTRGHPHLVQLLCYETVILKNEQEPAARRLATPADVEAAIGPALETGSFFFADIEQNQVGAAGRALLGAIARQGEGQAVSRAALARQVPSPLATPIDDLLQRDLIEAVNGGYRFQVELIRRWFDRD